MTSRYYAEGELIAEKYELVSPIGEGGMGSVWLARNRSLDTRVALKLLKADLDAADAAERLSQEARAAARIGHRAIVRVFDFGHTEQGDPFIVMEFLEGDNLASVLASRGRLTPVQAVQTLLPIIDALSAAHARGIVHRDLKPDNIFLVREHRRTQPKVVDFGIAKVHDAAHPARTLTRQGTVLGSPGYMSPEQARGLPGVDQRTDVWSVCVVLYECITGRPAFDGDNYNALMRAIIEDSVVPSTELAAGDATLWSIIEYGLRKAPEERWPSMRSLGIALVEWLLSHGVDQDVCGDAVSTLLDEPAQSGPRDILSIPRAAAVTPGRLTPLNAITGNLGTVEVPSVPAGPESTSGIARTGIPPVLRRAPVAVGVVLVTVAIIVTLVLLGRSGDAPSADAPPTLAAPSVPAAVPPPAPVVEAPPPVVEEPAAPQSAVTADEAPPSRPVTTSQRAKKAGKPVASKPAPPPAAPRAPEHADLKDPY